MKNLLYTTLLIVLSTFISAPAGAKRQAPPDSNRLDLSKVQRAKQTSPSGIHSASKKELSFLQNVEDKYQKKQGLHIRLKRKVVLAALDTEKNSTGEAWVHSGKLNLDIQSPIPEKVVVDGTYIWMVSPAPKEFKGAKTQVIQSKLNSKRARSQGLLQILTKGGFLKYFKVAGVEQKKSLFVYYLEPGKYAKEFKRAQVIIDKEKKEIRELLFWDKMDNLTNYKFIKTKFDQPMISRKFKYTPPKDAEITAL